MVDYNRAFFRNKLGTQFHGTHHKFHFKLLVAEVSLRGIRLRLVTEIGCEVYLYLVRLSQLTARCTGAVALGALRCQVRPGDNLNSTDRHPNYDQPRNLYRGHWSFVWDLSGKYSM